jgi:hypothetical protein
MTSIDRDDSGEDTDRTYEINAARNDTYANAAYEQEQWEFAHPIEVSIQRTIWMGGFARFRASEPRSFDSTDVADHPGDDAGPFLPEDAPWFSPEEEAREDELGASFGDARRCPRHPGVKISSDDGMFDGDCYVCEGESEEEYHRHEQAQFEFAHPIEVAILRVEEMAYQARVARERKAAAEANDDICF